MCGLALCVCSSSGVSAWICCALDPYGHLFGSSVPHAFLWLCSQQQSPGRSSSFPRSLEYSTVRHLGGCIGWPPFALPALYANSVFRHSVHLCQRLGRPCPGFAAVLSMSHWTGSAISRSVVLAGCPPGLLCAGSPGSALPTRSFQGVCTCSFRFRILHSVRLHPQSSPLHRQSLARSLSLSCPLACASGRRTPVSPPSCTGTPRQRPPTHGRRLISLRTPVAMIHQFPGLPDEACLFGSPP